MILFPNAKINLGLRVVAKRHDGYHELETIMMPVPWCDVLEIVPSSGTGIRFSLVGNDRLDCKPEDNLVVKAAKAVEKYIDRKLPSMSIYLKKNIPFGAGLGGGSADASFTIVGINELFELNLGMDEMAEIAVSVGADCPFFIYNTPMLAKGIGEKLTPIDLSCLNGLAVLIVKPKSDAVSTREAYSNVILSGSDIDHLDSIVRQPLEFWKENRDLVNDFEHSIFPIRPEIEIVKDVMYRSGAVYSSMSGSGAAVYGFFNDVKMADKAKEWFVNCDIFSSVLSGF